MTKNPSQINNILKQEMKKPTDEFIEITKVNYADDENLVRLSLNTKLSTGTFAGDVTINHAQNLLLIQSPTTTRHKIKKFLAQVIENVDSGEIIHNFDLNLSQSIKLFKLIADENKSNIIEVFTFHFQPELGFKYGKEIYTEISYKFIENRCASEHQDFKELSKNAKRATMKLVVSKCRNLVKNNKIKLIIKPDRSFRTYTDIDQEVWDDFCFNVGCIDN